MKKLVSIIIPTYNMEALLDQCLTSLILPDKEQRAKLDVIVVIDGATDRSSEIAHGYESRYPETFRVLDKANGNYGSCVNAALPWVKKNGGKYVRVLDADDSYYTENLADYLEVLENQDVDLVITPYNIVNPQGEVTQFYTFPLPESQRFMMSDIPMDTPYITMHAITYRSSIFEEIVYHQTEGISYTDMEWAVVPMQRVQSVYHFSRPIYRYLMGRDGQTMDAITQTKKLDHSVKSVLAQLKALDDVSQDNMARPWMEHVIDFLLIHIYGLGLSRLATLNLDEFDKTLQRDFPETYERSSNLTLPVGVFNLQMHFIKMWRRVRSRLGMRIFPKYILFILANRLKK